LPFCKLQNDSGISMCHDGGLRSAKRGAGSRNVNLCRGFMTVTMRVSPFSRRPVVSGFEGIFHISLRQFTEEAVAGFCFQ
jgi:hypothetical protein